MEWLTAQPQVHWVSPRAQTKASNFFATGISQSGSAATLADASNPAGASNDAGTHPLWDAGIDADWLRSMCLRMVACGAQCHGPCWHDVILLAVHVQCPSTALLAWSTPRLGPSRISTNSSKCSLMLSLLPRAVCRLSKTCLESLDLLEFLPDLIANVNATTCIDQSRLAGLNGENQIVGMGDTGIDWLHCTFTDSAHSGPGSGPYLTETAATGGYTYWVSTTHRKIVYYRQVDDNVDANGHGTHCAGSAVGSLQSPGQCPCCVQRSTASFTCGLCQTNAAKRHHVLFVLSSLCFSLLSAL